MSNISTAFDAIKDLMEATFTDVAGYYQLSNPYDIEENTIAALEKGWGVGLGPAVNTNRELSCRLSLQRAISITLTRRRYANELDTESKETAEKDLLEDHHTLIKELEKYPQINNSTSGIARFRYTGDGGIESTIVDNDAFIKITTSFDLEYFENLET